MKPVQAIFDGYTPRKDGSMTLRFVTQEMQPEEKFIMIQKYNTFGWLLFQEKEISDVDMPTTDNINDNRKSESQRLRSALFILWKQGGHLENFEVYYRHMMEKFIDHIKQKFED